MFKKDKAYVFGIVFTLLLAFCLLIEATLAAPNNFVTTQESSNDAFITEYPIPLANSQPRNIIVESSGRVWFTMSNGNAIGRLVATNSDTYDFTTYPAPSANTQPYDLVSDGTYIWFTEFAGNRIGRLTISDGSIIEYTIPTANSAPTGIDVAPDGTIWFVERSANQLGRFIPATQSFDEFPIPSQNALPEDLVVANNNDIWFTAPGIQRAILYEANTNDFNGIPTGDIGIAPWPTYGIALDQHGFPWVSAPSKGQVGRFAPGTLGFWAWFDIGSISFDPTGIDYRTTNNSNETWFVGTGSGRVGVFKTTLAGQPNLIIQASLPTPNSQPMGIAVDENGHAWITESSGNKIAEWKPPYANFTYLPAILK